MLSKHEIMKQTIILATLLLCSAGAMSQGLISENKELPRSTFITYRSAEAALADIRSTSENYATLDGEWYCQWFDDAAKIPVSIFETNAKLDNLKKISLPASNELSGLSEAIFSQSAYPFLKAAPRDDFSVNVSGAVVLARDFSIPFDYTDRALFLHIGAASSALTVYINGKRVGYSTDSRNPAEFDISKYIIRGRNRIALHVTRYCDGSFLEDQTGWRLSGINRDMFLFAQPKIRMRDYMVRTTLDPTYRNGLLETALLLKTQLLNPHKVTVYYDLFDPNGKLVNQANREVEVGLRGEDTVRFTATILDVKHWNAETPNLYTIQYRIKREGRWTEFAAVKTGFRTIEIKKGQMLINGKAVSIKGVNLSEFSPKTGSVQTPQEIEELVKEIKYAGFNAIRSDGYPLSAAFYDICDRMGVYVCDVANINAQGVGTSIYKGRTLANDPVWKDDFIYRVNNTYERNKSHTSVVMWALGDDAGNGYNMYEAYLMLQAKDLTRPIVYNGAGMEFNSDIYCPSDGTVAGFEQAKKYLNGQPVIFSRCSFDPAIWSTKGIQGGFLERWRSPSIATNARFERMNDEYKITKMSNGSIALPAASDRLTEISDLFRGVVVSAVDLKKGVFEFQNRLDFSNLSELEVTCSVVQNGKVKRHYLLNVTAAVGETVQVSVPKFSYSAKDQIVIDIKNIAKYEF